MTRRSTLAFVLASILVSTEAFTVVRPVQKPLGARQTQQQRFPFLLSATISTDGDAAAATDSSSNSNITSSLSSSSSSSSKDVVLRNLSSLSEEATQYSDMFELDDAGTAFYALFRAIRQGPIPLGLKGEPFCLRSDEVQQALAEGGKQKLEKDTAWKAFFTMKDLEKAVTDDFLDAARGSTDNRKGWQVGDCFVRVYVVGIQTSSIHSHLFNLADYRCLGTIWGFL